MLEIREVEIDFAQVHCELSLKKQVPMFDPLQNLVNSKPCSSSRIESEVDTPFVPFEEN
jgi:hypothetical protein